MVGPEEFYGEQTLEGDDGTISNHDDKGKTAVDAVYTPAHGATTSQMIEENKVRRWSFNSIKPEHFYLKDGQLLLTYYYQVFGQVVHEVWRVCSINLFLWYIDGQDCE